MKRQERDWALEEIDGLLLVRCRPLASIGGFAHAFSTRVSDGGDGFDLGEAGDPRPEVAQRRGRFMNSVGLGNRPVSDLSQVHGDRLVRMRDFTGSMEADGVIIERGDGLEVVPGIRTADCVPVILADTGGEAVAVIHAGWRGTAAGIVRRAVEELGTERGRMIASIGPSIRSCCYLVGPEVAEAVAAGSGCSESAIGRAVEGGIMLDLQEANGRQLLAAGIEDSRIFIAPWCTCCRSDLFFSYRRDGETAGRMMAVASPV